LRTGQADDQRAMSQPGLQPFEEQGQGVHAATLPRLGRAFNPAHQEGLQIRRWQGLMAA
jgi:hypothetical protein